MSEYKILMSKDGMDYFDALLKAQYQPSEANSKRVEEIENANTLRMIEGQQKAEIEFLKSYSKELLEFLRGISKPYFLYANSSFHQSWILDCDENDNYKCINFSKGKFSLVLDICGGYAGTEILEENLSFERVLELLNKDIDAEVSDTTGMPKE